MNEELAAAIAAQESRCKKDEQGNWLCRRCGAVVPEAFKMMYYLPDNPSKVWGPCCSNKCICYTKICSGCGKDFFVDKKLPSGKDEISYYGEGDSYCHECSKKLVPCASCGKIKKLTHETDSGKVCSSCFDQYYFTCSYCNNVHHKSYAVSSHDIVPYEPTLSKNSQYSRECFKKATKGLTPKEVFICGYCEGVRLKTEEVEDSGFCKFCLELDYVKRCDGCGLVVASWDRYGKRNKVFCNECQDHISYCSCGNVDLKKKMKKVVLKHSSDMCCEGCYVSSTAREECRVCFSPKVVGKACKKCANNLNYCDLCKTNHLGEGTCRASLGINLMKYSYKPMPYFNYINYNSKVFFGFENEINYDSENEKNRQIKEIYKKYKPTEVYLKPDASISGSGFEVVSSPMSLDFFKVFNLAHLFSVTPKLEDSSCGLHIHLSKGSFSGKVHLFKFIDFINGNKSFITKIAGRSGTSYACSYRGKKEVQNVILGKEHRERYRSVNLTNPSTYEVRIFKSARNEFELRYRVEFVCALVEFTRLCSLAKDASVEDFTKWIPSSEYSNLYKYVKTIS